jgi:threonine dehydratase
MPVTILVPHGNSTEKNAAMQAFGAELIEYGADFQEVREEATRLSGLRGLELVPSFHPDLVLGVATYAYKLFSAHRDLARLYVPIGQGSGICGCIAARDALGLETEIIGVQSEGAPAYALSFKAGQVVVTKTAETFADGMATRVPDEAALNIIRKGASRIVTVSDDAIADAIRHYWTDTHNLAEGAGAAPLAAALQERAQHPAAETALILCGGNIDLALFARRILQAPH